MGYVESKESAMQLIINSLSSNDELQQTFEYIANYCNKYKRMSYSEALKMLHELKKEEESAQIFAYIQFKLEMLTDDKLFQMFYVNLQNNDLEVDSEELKRFFLKIQDHISLEIIRFEDSLQESNKSYNRFKKELSEFSDFLAKQTCDIEAYSKEVESRVNAGVTTILGIFAAFIIAAFGGITVYGNTISSFEGLNIYHIILMTLLFGMILFNVCFLLIYSVAKISNRNIGVAIETMYRDVYYDSPTHMMNRVEHHNDSITRRDLLRVYWKTGSKNIWRFFKRKYYFFRDATIRFPLLFFFNLLMVIGMIIVIQFSYRTVIIYNLLISNDLVHRVLSGELFY